MEKGEDAALPRPDTFPPLRLSKGTINVAADEEDDDDEDDEEGGGSPCDPLRLGEVTEISAHVDADGTEDGGGGEAVSINSFGSGCAGGGKGCIKSIEDNTLLLELSTGVDDSRYGVGGPSGVVLRGMEGGDSVPSNVPLLTAPPLPLPLPLPTVPPIDDSDDSDDDNADGAFVEGEGEGDAVVGVGMGTAADGGRNSDDDDAGGGPVPVLCCVNAEFGAEEDEYEGCGE